MTPTENAATVVSATLTGAATMALQAASATDTLPLLTPLISALVGGGVAYGIMKATLTALQIEIRDLKHPVSRVNDVATRAANRVARIEGRLDMIKATEGE